MFPIWIQRVEGNSGQGTGLDITQFQTALAAFCDPSGWHELRGLEPFGIRWVQAQRPEESIDAARQLAHCQNLFWSVNPVLAPLNHSIRKNDPAERRWMFLDVDPIRPDGVSATEEEKDLARNLAWAVDEFLSDLGWPPPLIIDSGSGIHLFYRISLPSNELIKAHCSKFLRAISEVFSTATVRIENDLFGAQQMARVPGSWNRKGPGTGDRPHRPVLVLSCPETLEIVSLDLIQETTARLKPPATEPANQTDSRPEPREIEPLNPWIMRAGGSAPLALEAYLKSALARETARVELAPEGERNKSLNRAAFSLGTLVAHGLNQMDAVQALTLAGQKAGLNAHEIEATIRSGIESGSQEPRTLPGTLKPLATGQVQNVAQVTGQAPGETPEPLVVKFSEIKISSVDYLWQNRIPFGFITIVAGSTGVGKSFCLSSFAACLTRGIPAPDGFPLDPGRVLILSEDPYEQVLAPRLLDMGADLDRVCGMTVKAMATWTMADVETLDRAWIEAGQPELVIIDPPANFLGKADEHRNAEVRALLTRINDWMQQRKKVAVVLITHVNKPTTGRSGDASMRIMGSVAYTTTARVIHFCAEDPDDPKKRVFVTKKNNLGPLARGLSYSIEDDCPGQTIVKWHGEITTTADEAMGGTTGGARVPRKELAGQFLIQKFSESRSWPSEALEVLAHSQGISRNGLWEAKKVLPIKPRKEGTKWVWEALPGWPPVEQRTELSDPPLSAF
jgi:RecA-family ATPase